VPDFNPFAPTIETGGTAGVSAGPVGGQASAGLSLGSVASAPGQDNHWAAALLLVSLVTLWALWQSKFRFSMTVG